MESNRFVLNELQNVVAFHTHLSFNCSLGQSDTFLNCRLLRDHGAFDQWQSSCCPHGVLKKREEQLASILQWFYQNGQGQEEGERRGRESATINLVATNTPSKVSILILGFFPVLSATEEPLQAAMCNWQLRGGRRYMQKSSCRAPNPRAQVSNLRSALLTEFRALRMKCSSPQYPHFEHLMMVQSFRST